MRMIRISLKFLRNRSSEKHLGAISTMRKRHVLNHSSNNIFYYSFTVLNDNQETNTDIELGLGSSSWLHSAVWWSKLSVSIFIYADADLNWDRNWDWNCGQFEPDCCSNESWYCGFKAFLEFLNWMIIALKFVCLLMWIVHFIAMRM